MKIADPVADVNVLPDDKMWGDPVQAKANIYLHLAGAVMVIALTMTMKLFESKEEP
jgi:hypothetical protein